MIDQYLKELNKEQQEAVRHYEGPCMVYAGPGSGKTTVITHRIGYLINHYKINPSKILVISFTKAAADEMRFRFEAAYGKNDAGNRKVTFGTFHSVFFRILRSYYRYELGNILEESEKIGVIKNIVRTLSVGNPLDDELVKDIILDMGVYKSNILDTSEYVPSSLSKDDFLRVVFYYEDYKKNNNRIDFDDMLTKCYELLINESKVLQSLQNTYSHILIDEFQDINSVQFEIVKLIAKVNGNLFVVGDDDQSIYSFRGARPEFILEFHKLYPNTRKITLSLNYRSQEKIISTANKLISNNDFRISKSMVASKGPSVDIEIIRPRTRELENQEISSLIKNLKDSGHEYSDIAVIYRTNILSSSIVDSFLDNNIPFISRDNIYNIYEHWLAKDILSYLKAAVDINDRESLKRIINRPKRYITNKAKIAADEYHKDLITSLRIKGDLMAYHITYLDRLEVDLKNIAYLKPKDAIRYIRKDVGYDEYISSYCIEKQLNSSGLMEILDEIEDISAKHESVEGFIKHVSEFKESLYANKRSYSDKEDKVELLTMHSAKGLEFKVVIIIEAVEDIIPHSKSQDEESIEEERRLFYVAITRAKERLYIYAPISRYDKKADISRFVNEMEIIEEKIEKLDNGSEIFHKAFGRGLIENINKNIARVFFYNKKEVRELDMTICMENNLIE